MERCEGDALRNCRDFLVENMDMQYIINHLYQYSIIDEDQKEAIMAQKSRNKQAERFLGFIWQSKMPGLFTTLCQVFKETGNKFIVTELEIELQRIKTSAISLHPGRISIMFYFVYLYKWPEHSYF